jgi:hypothetical protein
MEIAEEDSEFLSFHGGAYDGDDQAENGQGYSAEHMLPPYLIWDSPFAVLSIIVILREAL